MKKKTIKKTGMLFVGMLMLIATIYGAMAVQDFQDRTSLDQEIDRLKASIDVDKDFVTDSPRSPGSCDSRSKTLDCFPQFDDWICPTGGQGEYECLVDKCRALKEVRGRPRNQIDACGDWRNTGRYVYEQNGTVSFWAVIK